MEKIAKLFATLVLAAFTLPASAALNVFACEPEWAALAQELGGDKVSVFAATTALQDVHRIEAKPSLIARMRSADILVCTGGELEVGWLPQLLGQAGNAKVQPGRDGYFEAAPLVARLEIPKTLDRSQGDIHPGGNPHVHGDPRNVLTVAAALTARLARIDAPNAAFYNTRGAAFAERWKAALARWEQQAAPLKGARVIVYHRDSSYLINWLGLKEAGSLEPRPGIPPTPGHLAELLAQVQREPAKMILYSAYNDPRAAQFLAGKSGVPAVMLPFTVGGSERAKDLFGLFDDSIAKMLGSLK